MGEDGLFRLIGRSTKLFINWNGSLSQPNAGQASARFSSLLDASNFADAHNLSIVRIDGAKIPPEDPPCAA